MQLEGVEKLTEESECAWERSKPRAKKSGLTNDLNVFSDCSLINHFPFGKLNRCEFINPAFISKKAGLIVCIFAVPYRLFRNNPGV